MSPVLKKLVGHIAFGLSVSLCHTNHACSRDLKGRCALRVKNRPLLDYFFKPHTDYKIQTKT